MSTMLSDFWSFDKYRYLYNPNHSQATIYYHRFRKSPQAPSQPLLWFFHSWLWSKKFLPLHIIFFCFWDSLATQFKLALNSLRSPGWPWSLSNLPTSASRRLESQVCAATPGCIMFWDSFTLWYVALVSFFSLHSYFLIWISLFIHFPLMNFFKFLDFMSKAVRNILVQVFLVNICFCYSCV